MERQGEWNQLTPIEIVGDFGNPDVQSGRLQPNPGAASLLATFPSGQRVTLRAANAGCSHNSRLWLNLKSSGAAGFRHVCPHFEKVAGSQSARLTSRGIRNG